MQKIDPFDIEKLILIFKNKDHSPRDYKVFTVYYGWMGLTPQNADHARMIFETKWGLTECDLTPLAMLMESGLPIPPALSKQIAAMMKGKHDSGYVIKSRLHSKFEGDERKVPRKKQRNDQRNTLIIAEYKSLREQGETKMNAYSSLAGKYGLSPHTIRKINNAGSSFYKN